MMKRNTLIVLLVLCLMAGTTSAQTWNEWFRQKQTQKQYLVQQIAALKVYLGYLKQGYDLADKGLTIVGDIRNGNYSDHKDFFSSFLRVNPSIRNLPHFKMLSGFYGDLKSDLISMNKSVRESTALTESERDYVGRIYKDLQRRSDEIAGQLTVLLTDDQLQLNDQERLVRITTAYHDLKDLHAFSQSFFSATHLLIRQREREGVAIEMAKNLNDVSL
jgi:hypothetical protein